MSTKLSEKGNSKGIVSELWGCCYAMTFSILNNTEQWKNMFPIPEFLNVGTKSCCSNCMCHWFTFYWWCNENDSIWGCRCYVGWRNRVQHWCIINCRILQVNYDQCPVSSVIIDNFSNNLSFFPSDILNLIMETCRSRALTTKYNSSPLEASRPFDCGRDGFV